ncbi:MAG: hypothetical protein ACU85V_07200 [Gammaproteobacteria bacterium]
MDLTLTLTRTSCGACALAAASLLWAGGAGAAPVAVVNPGFEDISGESMSNEFTFGPLSGWDLYDPGNVTSGGEGPTYYIGTLTPFEPDPVGSPGVYANFPGGAPEGERVGIAFNFAGSGGGGEYGFEQKLAAILAPNTTYTLTVAIGNIASATSSSGTFFDLDGFPGYRIELLAGGEVLAADDNGLSGAIPEGEFMDAQASFTTGAAHPNLGAALGIRLVNLNVVDPLAPGADLEVDFDHVRLDAAPVPLPAAAWSLLAGALALVGAGHRRRAG